MARRQFELLFAELAKRWPDAKSVRLVHRLGRVPVSEASLWVEVTAPHRAEAFAACQWLIDEMKRVVPIWKRPIPAQGSSECSAASPSMAELRFDAGSATTINSRG
jgi:molybdopterin synthase catalytic subunit